MQDKEKKETLHLIDKLVKELELVKQELKNDLVTPLIASFGFVIALVWRDAFRSTIDEFLLKANLVEKAYVYEIISAMIITILAAAIIIWITKFKRKKRRERIEKIVEKDIKKLEENIEKKSS